MIADILWLVASLTIILVGANILVEGASALARRFGMSELTVGLTIVAFGTSTPELAISVLSAAQGATSLAVGNVVGSNIFNILVIIGITALIRPLKVEKSIMTDQMPMMVLSAIIMLMLGYSQLLDGTPENVISRTSGIFLLLLFGLFMIYTVQTSRNSKSSQDTEVTKTVPLPLWRSVVYVLGGLAGLVWGGDKFVSSASGLARELGMSEAMIGLTIVAIGTSLPELATSVVAAVKNRPGLAVGNVIGSNIFNVTLILGAAAAISPLSFGTIGHVDLCVLVVASLLFWLMGKVWGDHVIKRGEGALLLGIYIAYTAWLICQI